MNDELDAVAYVAVPSALLDHPTLSRTARHLWTTLVRVADADEAVPLSVSQVATLLGAAPATVRRARADLVAEGWLEVTAGGGRGNVPTWRPLRRVCAEEVLEEDLEDLLAGHYIGRTVR